MRTFLALVALVAISLAGCLDEEDPVDSNDVGGEPAPAPEFPGAPESQEVFSGTIGDIGAATGREPFDVPEGNWTELEFRVEGLIPIMIGAMDVQLVAPNGETTDVVQYVGVRAGAGVGVGTETGSASYQAGAWHLEWRAVGAHQIDVTVTVQ